VCSSDLLVYKPIETASIYVAYGNSQTASVATVRLGCTSGSGANFVNFCDVAPEKARNIELGAKIDLMDRRLQLTAALFRNERTNYRVSTNDPTAPSTQTLDGKARVDGIALGATGNITPDWSIFANYTFLDSKVRQSLSDYCLANPGAACNNSAALPDPGAGDELVQTPRHAAGLFTTYTLPFGLQLGYGMTYQGSFRLNQRNLLFRSQLRSDDYLTHRLFLSYPVTEALTAQLNIQNLTNEKYLTNIRHNVSSTTGAISGGWATPGEARSAVFSLSYTF
jgi:catecholate siderophore receptor